MPQVRARVTETVAHVASTQACPTQACLWPAAPQRPLHARLEPRAVEKARSLACDVVILDLEDAVLPDAKERARDDAVAAVKAGGSGGGKW